MKLRLNTEKGVYKYHFTPIYEGIKPINKEISKENLFLLKDMCDKWNIKFILFYGTLLGAAREHDFISHDEDIDLAMRREDMRTFENMLFELREQGFELARYEKRGFLSIIRKGEYIDIYFYETFKDDPRLKSCCRNVCKKEYIDDLTEMPFQGRPFYVPKNYLAYLQYYYGENWKTPIKTLDFNLSPARLKREYLIQFAKAFLMPSCVTEYLQEKKAKPTRDKWLKHLYEVEQLEEEG